MGGWVVGSSAFVGVAIDLVVASANLVTKKNILTALPLLWLGRQKSLILICPPVVFIILAIRDLKVCLGQFPLWLRHIRPICRSVIPVFVRHARYTILALHVSGCCLSVKRDACKLTGPILKADTWSTPPGIAFPSSFWSPAKNTLADLVLCHDQSLNRTNRVDTPCSHKLAFTAGVNVAPLSDCILVAHCESKTTAQFRVEASVWRAFMIDCNACLRFTEGVGPWRD